MEAEGAEGWRRGVGGGVGYERIFQRGETRAPFGELTFVEVGGDGGAGPGEVGELRHEGGERNIFFREDEGEVRPEFERGGGVAGPAVVEGILVVVGK